ncbi:MAG: hypothetical protein HYY04_14830, partial [Chloroflexi bacterium]|nr:hypothetical protein [Chloroflexota bacterium]
PHAPRPVVPSPRRPVALLLTLLLIGAYVYFRVPPGPNELTRFFSIVVLVDEGVPYIDRYAGLTPDKGYHNGHYYSDKAPGTFLLGVPIYAALRVVASAFGLALPPSTALAVLQVLLAALPSAVQGVLLFDLLRRLGSPEGRALGLTLSFGLATIAFPFASMLFGHQLASSLAFAAFALLVRLRLRTGDYTEAAARRRVVISGLLAGLATLVEYPAVIVVVALLGYLWLTLPRRLTIPFLVGGVPSAIALVAYNWLVFGDPFRLSYQYVSDPIWAGMREGFVGLTYPRLSALAEVLVGPRGLLSFSPHLVFGMIGLRRLARDSRLRPEGWFCAFTVAAFLLLNASYYAPIGHWSMGPRFLTIAIPYLVIPAAAALVTQNRQMAYCALAGLSFLFVFAGTAVDPKVRTEIVFPLVDYFLPRLIRGEVQPTLLSEAFGTTGFPTLLPLIAWLVGGIVLVWASLPRRVAPLPASAQAVEVGVVEGVTPV